ncbi:MAG TPA: hypothetical protein VK952_08745 [Methylotenera sp.]|nr:hypothetical protein [Methylotenera sp.]
MKSVALARLASFFLLLSQKKETKEKATPLPPSPSVLAPHLGGCGTRAFSTQTALAAFHLPLKPKALQGDFKVKTS